jgi:hypothetical protein
VNLIDNPKPKPQCPGPPIMKNPKQLTLILTMFWGKATRLTLFEVLVEWKKTLNHDLSWRFY